MNSPCPHPCAAAIAAAFALAVCPAAASALTFDAACSGTTGNAASLKMAINQANATAGADTVDLGQGCLYRLSAVDNNWYGTNGLPAIASDITIEGNGSTISRRGATVQNPPPRFRLFFVGADPSNASTDSYTSPGPRRLTLRDLSLHGGLAHGGDSNGGG